MDNEEVEYLEEKNKRRFATLFNIMGIWADRQNRVLESINSKLHRGIYDKDLLEGGCQNYPIGEKRPKKS